MSFRDIFPSFEGQIQALHSLLIPVAAVLMIAGLLSAMRYAYTPRSMLRALMVTVLITTALALWPQWMTLAQESLQTLVDEMDASPNNTADRYMELLVARGGGDEGRFSLFNVKPSFVIDLLVTGALQLVGILASFLIWLAYLLQKFFLGFSYALAPVFLGMLALRSTSIIGVRFILGTAGILLWPLGWAAAAVGTSNLIDLFTRQELAGFAPAYAQQSYYAAAIIGFWIIISTLIAPVVIQMVISSGANAGAVLARGTLTGSADAVKAGLATAATIASGGSAGLALAAAGGAAAGGSSLLGAAMKGGGGALSGHSLQSLVPQLRSIGGGGSPVSSSPSPSRSRRAPDSAPPRPPSSLKPSSSQRIADISGDQRVAEPLAQSHQSPRS